MISKFLINISSTCIYGESYYNSKNLIKIPKYLFIKCKAHELISLKKNSKNLIVGILNENAPFPAYPYSKLESIGDLLKASRLDISSLMFTKLLSLDPT